jgi:hypothetical protein
MAGAESKRNGIDEKYGILFGKFGEKKQLQDIAVNCKIVLIFMLEIYYTSFLFGLWYMMGFSSGVF